MAKKAPAKTLKDVYLNADEPKPPKMQTYLEQLGRESAAAATSKKPK